VQGLWQKAFLPGHSSSIRTVTWLSTFRFRWASLESLLGEYGKRGLVLFPSVLTALLAKSGQVVFTAEQRSFVEADGDAFTVGGKAESNGELPEVHAEELPGLGAGVVTIAAGHREPPAEGKKWSIRGP
jgi:hypothetical protein